MSAIPLRIMCGTYNVNATTPDEALDSWLCRSRKPPHLIVVALQEIVDLSAVSNYIVADGSQDAAYAWARAAVSTLRNHPGYSHVGFRLLRKPQFLVGVALIVMVQSGMRSLITDVQVSEASSGALGGYIGNKGACALRLRICGSGVRPGVQGQTLCFIGGHLAAHQHEVERRNADVSMIQDKIQFPIMVDAPHRHHKKPLRSRRHRPVVAVGSLDGCEPGRDCSSSEEESGDADGDAAANFHASLTHHSVLESHAVFWMGDLNYRVDGFTWQEAHALVKDLKLRELLAKDQLTVSRAAGRVFVGFREGVINFVPTYKFEPGTSHYDRRASKKIRVPAWCDRILWRSQIPIVQDDYFSCTSVFLSDHKPVGSLFTVPGVLLRPSASSPSHDAVAATASEMSQQRSPRSPAPVYSGSWEGALVGHDIVCPCVMVAKHDFAPRSDDELGFKKGDRIEVVSLSGPDPGWYVGRAYDQHSRVGRRGFFPANYIKAVAAAEEDQDGSAVTSSAHLSDARTAGLLTSQRDPDRKVQRVDSRISFDLRAADHGTTVVAQQPSSGVRGQHQGSPAVRRAGAKASPSRPPPPPPPVAKAAKAAASASVNKPRPLSVPATQHVPSQGGGVLSRSPSRRAPAAPTTVVVTAAHSYAACAVDELSFSRGQTIEVVSRSSHEEGWWLGRIDGVTGIFPSNYIRGGSTAEHLTATTGTHDELAQHAADGALNGRPAVAAPHGGSPKTDMRVIARHGRSTSAPPTREALLTSPPGNGAGEPVAHVLSHATDSYRHGKHGSGENPPQRKGKHHRWKRHSRTRKDDDWRQCKGSDGEQGNNGGAPPAAGDVRDGHVFV